MKRVTIREKHVFQLAFELVVSNNWPYVDGECIPKLRTTERKSACFVIFVEIRQGGWHFFKNSRKDYWPENKCHIYLYQIMIIIIMILAPNNVPHRTPSRDSVDQLGLGLEFRWLFCLAFVAIGVNSDQLAKWNWVQNSRLIIIYSNACIDIAGCRD